MITNILETVLQKELPENKKNFKVLAINECSEDLITRAYAMSANVEYGAFRKGYLSENHLNPEPNEALLFTFSDSSELYLLITNKTGSSYYKDSTSKQDFLNLKINSVQNLSIRVLELNKEIDNLKQEIIIEKDKKIIELETKIKELENNTDVE